MNPLFADTFYWYGLCNRHDQWHQIVIAAHNRIAGRRIVTTDEVLVEFASAMASDPFLRAAARLLIDSILADPSVTVIPQSHETFLAGWALYTQRPDKGYSLVDCISMVCCRAERITDILTNDHHFEQEGFATLLKR
ncbi:MAG TPA: PIN domain-containing protein [Chthonomonadaceae bacterium]|nr:PIN domain-containing protein [Chthonomonadaceae bacterium]